MKLRKLSSKSPATPGSSHPESTLLTIPLDCAPVVWGQAVGRAWKAVTPDETREEITWLFPLGNLQVK